VTSGVFVHGVVALAKERMASPFIKIVGGKRALAPSILNLMPPDFDVYIEPFVGGGAVYYALHDAERLNGALVVLGDVSKDLIILYEAARDHPEELLRDVDRITDTVHPSSSAGYVASGEMYYRQRELWNKGERTPARQLYLRANCFNGIWRENKKGEFNVPWRKELPHRVDDEKLQAASRALNNPKVELLDWDFRDYEGGDVVIGEGTCVYLDSPYLGGWSGYTAEGWTTQDMIDLVQLAALWSKRGARVVLSHVNTCEIRALLEHWPGCIAYPIAARRSVNSDGSGRGPVQELLITQ
jgi:DNA adenine methylase